MQHLPFPICLSNRCGAVACISQRLVVYSDQNRSHRQNIALTLSHHFQFRDGQRQDVGPLFTFTKGSSHFLWVILWLKAIVLGSMLCSSADRHFISVDLSPQKQYNYVSSLGGRHKANYIWFWSWCLYSEMNEQCCVMLHNGFFVEVSGQPYMHKNKSLVCVSPGLDNQIFSLVKFFMKTVIF